MPAERWRQRRLQGHAYDARVIERLQRFCGGRARLPALLAICALGLGLRLDYGIGRGRGGPSAGRAPPLPLAIYPALLEYQAMLMTEPLGATLLAATALCFLRACESRSPASFVGCGLLLGALVMVRPEFLVLIALLPMLAAFRLRGAVSWRQVVLPAGVLAAAACLVILPWTIRNLVVLDRFV